jgi:23S rRNA (cytidine1920-2'-O)/16S rRNA (cytidine1409-2'-O)-methyltransferase
LKSAVNRTDKVRIDLLVVEAGLAPTREKARRLVLAGEVLINDVPVEKPGALVDRAARLRLRTNPSPFVGRGGDKLAGALDELDLGVTGLRVLDIGASTGGFTDCLLQRGASTVTALDVGKGQLDWKLRSDPRVIIVEGVNARYLEKHDFPEGFDLVTIDVSFISLSKIIPAAAPLIRNRGRMLALVKPQFELTREDVESGGVVRDPAKHLEALRSVAEAAEACGLGIEAVAASPITGMEGNREFFLLMSPEPTKALAKESFEACARNVSRIGVIESESETT